MEMAHFKRRAILGHLFVTLPALSAAVVVVLYREYLALLAWPYQLTTAIAVGYQWYAVAPLLWGRALRTNGGSEAEAEEGTNSRLASRLPSVVGLVGLHTCAAAIGATYLNAWLAGTCTHWILPFVGASVPLHAMDFYREHFVLFNVIPAVALAYVMCRRFPAFASWAWLLPTVVIVYKLLSFSDPNVSVLTDNNEWHGFSYYFAIQGTWPRFDELGGSYAHRVFQQLEIVAPFYFSIAYSVSAFVDKKRVWERVAHSLRRQYGPETLPIDAVVANDHGTDVS